MILTDTHCHIHERSYPDAEAALERARLAGVSRLVCVGTDETTSQEAVEFARDKPSVWASVGLHPHDAKSGLPAVKTLEELLKKDKSSHLGKIVAIGECGLDYFYTHSPKSSQRSMLEAQLELASRYDLPVIFHVREAFDDFWPIFDNFKGTRGVLHSYTDTAENLDQGLSRGLYIGVNGISTFTKDPKQRDMFATIPLENLVFETDAPFLTPVPHRGMVNEPAFITHVAHHIANLQSINLKELSRVTERNATTLFFSN
jgi:TatD DNase family protein